MNELITAADGNILTALNSAAIIRVRIESLLTVLNLLTHRAGLSLAVLSKQSILGVITATLAMTEQEHHRLIGLNIGKHIGYIIETYICIGRLSIQ